MLLSIANSLLFNDLLIVDPAAIKQLLPIVRGAIKFTFAPIKELLPIVMLFFVCPL